MGALTVRLGADITSLKRALASVTELVGASARRMGKLTGAGLAGLGKGGIVTTRNRHFIIESAHCRTDPVVKARLEAMQAMFARGIKRCQIAAAFGRDLRRVRSSVIGGPPSSPIRLELVL